MENYLAEVEVNARQHKLLLKYTRARFALMEFLNNGGTDHIVLARLLADESLTQLRFLASSLELVQGNAVVGFLFLIASGLGYQGPLSHTLCKTYAITHLTRMCKLCKLLLLDDDLDETVLYGVISKNNFYSTLLMSFFGLK